MTRVGKIVIIMTAAALGGLAIWRLTNGGRQGRRPVTPPSLVEAATVRTVNVPVYLDAPGTVVPYHTVTVQPMITGPLQRILFHQGQEVKAGELLAEIDSAPFEASLQQAQAKLAQDQATLANAELQAQQYAMLVTKNYTSKQQAAQAEATEAEDRAQVQQDAAAIKTARINLGYTRLRAPISGLTGILQVDAGNIVSPNLANGIVTINTIQPISVQFSLPQQDLPQIQAAMKAGTVTVLATAQGNPASAAVLDRGTLAVLDNAVNASTGTLTLKANFPNPEANLWPGAFVNVRLRARVIDNAVIIPSVALQQGPDGAFVYVVKHGPGNKTSVAMQPVTVGYAPGNIAVISKGLTPDEQVVTEGTAQLRAGTAVRIVQPTQAAKPNT